ncbi:MAG: sigma-54 dependent transcriptional regulator [Bacteroides sp.]|jgi:two-component system response regulator HydG|nr:sigma-54 dependent transcriptional regulator [Bacteroides sp.]
MRPSILIIDDDPYIITLLDNYFKREGYLTYTSSKGKAALQLIRSKRIDVVLCDIRLPDINGTELLQKIQLLSPDSVVIMMTAYAEIRAAVESIQSGAFDYVTKPIYPEEISDIVQRAIQKKSSIAEKEVEYITGNSPRMLNIIDQAKLVAPTHMSVLIQGETGSGKEYIARLIHGNSARKNKKFVAIDCGAIPRELAASELFGHVKGAFTGAIANKSGYFEQANSGTIFLDEIGNLPYETQVKLLRVIQQKVITRVGDSKSIDVDVRIISASNRDLLKALGDGHFREDLYHRINEFKIELPPLRERGDDILIFARHFLKEANLDLKKNVKDFDDDVVKAFKNYSWYGNLREMHNVVKRSVLIARGDFVSLDCLPEELRTENDRKTELEWQDGNALDLKNASEIAEKRVVEKALKEANYNKSLAARILKIDRKTLYNKLSRFGINY